MSDSQSGPVTQAIAKIFSEADASRDTIVKTKIVGDTVLPVTPVDTIKTLEARPNVYSSRFISVDQDAVQFPNGAVGEYNVINMAEKKGAVMIPVAFFRGNPYFGIVEQYRYPVKTTTLEFPRGGAALLDEDGANKELEEELGQTAKRLDLVCTLRPDTGILSTEVGVWIAIMDSSVISQNHVEDITGLRSRWVSEGQLIGLIASGQLTCGITLAAYTLFSINRDKYGMLMR